MSGSSASGRTSGYDALRDLDKQWDFLTVEQTHRINLFLMMV